MKVVVAGGYAPSLINFRGELFDALAAAGHEVIACAAEDDPEVRRALAQRGIAYRPIALSRTGANPLADLETIRQFHRAWREIRPDLVLAYTIKPVAYGLFAARLAGVPGRHAMITGLGTGLAAMDSQGARLKRAIAMAAYRQGLKGATAVLFQNREDQAFFERHGLIGAASRRALIDGSGVNLDRFAQHPPQGGPATFLMITRLLIDKGLRDYAAAARLVKAKHPDVRFSLVGPMDQGPSALPEAELDGWQREGVIDYRGAAGDVRPHLQAASAFVLPSYYPEGLPRSILEAMAIGRAVITTDLPGCRETVRPGENGFLVPPHDPEALARAMLDLLADPERMRTMGAASRRMAEERFDVHMVNRAILEVLGIARPGGEPAAAADGGLSRLAS